MRVLIADDDGDLRDLLEILLADAGYDAIAVSDGTAAMDILMADDPPRALILDWAMPEINGIDICRRLREMEKDSGRAYSYIVIVTGRDEASDVLAGLDAGADDFITKPFSGEELARRIRTQSAGPAHR